MSEISSALDVCNGFGCDGKDPNAVGDAGTVKSTSIYGRTIELRYSNRYKTAWGRITHGQPGDVIWVDRSNDGGKTWQQLGVTSIQNGGDTHTVMYYDDRLLMRAGGKAGNRPAVAVTEWY